MFYSLLLATALLSNAQAFDQNDLKTGDVLLQSVPCYVCSMIEIEEGRPFSHSGVVLKTENEISVLESWDNIQKISLAHHLSLRTKHTATTVLRPIDANGNEIIFDTAKVSEVFDRDFSGLKYDEAFLWDNSDSHGELLYCSEFVAKFLDRFIPVAFATKPMHFTKYRNDWIKYFHGKPPDGLPGISPADFEKSPLLKEIGQI